MVLLEKNRTGTLQEIDDCSETKRSVKGAVALAKGFPLSVRQLFLLFFHTFLSIFNKIYKKRLTFAELCAIIGQYVKKAQRMKTKYFVLWLWFQGTSMCV